MSTTQRPNSSISASTTLKGEAVTETGNDLIQHFSNGRVLTFTPFEMTTIKGFTANLVNPTHRLSPSCLLMNHIDDEDRLTIKIKLAFGNIPVKSAWARVGALISMRSYALHTPEWRQGDDAWQKDREHGARDKIVMRSNTESLVLEPPRLTKSFKMQNLVSGVANIPDEIWKPCLDFSVAAAHMIRNGEFPDFSELNRLQSLTSKTYHPTARIMSYEGQLKPAKM